MCGKWETPTVRFSVSTKEQLTLARQIYIRTSQTCIDGPFRKIRSLSGPPRDSSESTYTMGAA